VVRSADDDAAVLFNNRDGHSTPPLAAPTAETWHRDRQHVVMGAEDASDAGDAK
jgi:hypothetical protein